MENREYEVYVENIAHLLMDCWDPKFRRYVGINIEDIKEMITDPYGSWALIRRNTGKLYDKKVPIKEAVTP